MSFAVWLLKGWLTVVRVSILSKVFTVALLFFGHVYFMVAIS